MSKTPAELAREQRLAAKLRENLKRRKQQARARATPLDAASEPANPSSSFVPPDAAPEPESDR